MKARNTTLGTIEALLGRIEFLDALAEGAACERALVDSMGVSRSTVDRATRELESMNVIERAANGFAPTSLGRALVGEYTRFERRIEGIVAASDLLSMLDPRTDLDTTLLVGAEIVQPDPVAPHVPGSHMEDLLSQAERITCLAHAYSYARSMDLFYPLVMEQGVRMDAVFPAEMVAFIQSAHPERFGQLLDREYFNAFTVEHTPFGLFVVETSETTRACLVAYDDDNQLKGTITNTSAEAVEWGEHTYRTHRERAEPVVA